MSRPVIHLNGLFFSFSFFSFFVAIMSGTVTKDKGGTWPIVISYPDLTLFYTWEIWVRDLANS